MTTMKNTINSSSINEAIHEDTSVKKLSSYLDNVKVAVVSGGGIAAIEVPKLVRELRRHGASTHIYMTENCLKFIGIESMRWASQNEVIITPSGLSEHICTADAVAVVPTTADILSKIKNGICSDAATTLIQSALGEKKTVILCETMHNSLSNSPIIVENKNYLKKLPNIYFIEPRKEEGKQKIPEVKTLALNICHIINKQQKKIKENLLITYGGTRVMLDPVRCITNLSTGILGEEVIQLFYGMGYGLTVLAAHTISPLPHYENIELHHLPDYQDMFNFAQHIDPKNYAGLIHLVAASDFCPDTIENSKIRSDSNKLTINFSKTKKLLSHTNLKDIKFKAAAKLTEGDEQGLKHAYSLLNMNNLNAVLWNKAAVAWNKNERPHSGIFLENEDGKIIEINVSEKKQIALCYLNAFLKHKSNYTF